MKCDVAEVGHGLDRSLQALGTRVWTTRVGASSLLHQGPCIGPPSPKGLDQTPAKPPAKSLAQRVCWVVSSDGPKDALSCTGYGKSEEGRCRAGGSGQLGGCGNREGDPRPALQLGLGKGSPPGVPLQAGWEVPL